jgi:ADP-ribosylglycohydrolase
MDRARLSLEGLSLGDAFGQRFFFRSSFPDGVRAHGVVPIGPWEYTDDTAMALGIVAVLGRCGRIVQDPLATEFADRYRREPARGYAPGAHDMLQRIGDGAGWRDVAREAFGGQGSMGNGGAMRVAPVGTARHFGSFVRSVGNLSLRSGVLFQ